MRVFVGEMRQNEFAVEYIDNIWLKRHRVPKYLKESNLLCCLKLNLSYIWLEYPTKYKTKNVLPNFLVKCSVHDVADNTFGVDLVDISYALYKIFI